MMLCLGQLFWRCHQETIRDNVGLIDVNVGIDSINMYMYRTENRIYYKTETLIMSTDVKVQFPTHSLRYIVVFLDFNLWVYSNIIIYPANSLVHIYCSHTQQNVHQHPDNHNHELFLLLLEGFYIVFDIRWSFPIPIPCDYNQ